MCRSIKNTLAAFVITTMATGCISMVAPYDLQTENSLMSINGKASEILIDLEKNQRLPQKEYKQFHEAYKAIHLELSDLELRASAIPKNHSTQKQIALLTQTVKKLEALHQLDFGKTPFGKQEAIKTSKISIKHSLSAMLKLELAKKRGIIVSTTTTEEEGS